MKMVTSVLDYPFGAIFHQMLQQTQSLSATEMHAGKLVKWSTGEGRAAHIEGVHRAPVQAAAAAFVLVSRARCRTGLGSTRVVEDWKG